MKPIPTHYDRAASITRGINWRGARILERLQDKADRRLTCFLIVLLCVSIGFFFAQL